MKKVIVGYTVYFKGRPEERDEPIRISLEGGREAMKQWREGKPALMLKGRMYSTNTISKIEPTPAWSTRDAQRKLESGEGLLEGDENKALAKHLGRIDVLQPVSKFGSDLAKQLPEAS